MLSVNMFPYDEILKVFKGNSDLISEFRAPLNTPKIPQSTKFQVNQFKDLGATGIYNLGIYIGKNTIYDVIIT